MSQSKSKLSVVFPTRASRVFALALVAALVCSGFFALYQMPPRATAYDGYMSLDIAVSPSGSSFKLGVNESKTFTVEALNGTAPFSYVWSIRPSGNFSLSVNGAVREVFNGSSFEVSGRELTLCYPAATEEFVSVNVVVKDKRGISGSLLVPFVVADPYTSPGYKFDASTATASYIVTADGLGWYRAINGSDGSVSWTSTNFKTVAQNAIDNANGGIVSLDASSTSYKLATGEILIIRNGTKLIGPGSYTTVYGDTDTTITACIERLTGTDQAIISTDPATATQDVEIRGITLDMNFLSLGVGIKLFSTRHFILNDITIKDGNVSDSVAIALLATNSSLTNDQANTNNGAIDNIEIYSAYKGIYMEGYNASHVVTNIVFGAVHQWSIYGRAYDFVAWTDSITFKYAYNQISSGGNAVVFNSGTPTTANGVGNIKFEYLEATMAGAADYPVVVNNCSESNEITTRFTTGQLPYVQVQNGGKVFWLDNIATTGSLMRVWGSVDTAAGADVNHGLVATPTILHVTAWSGWGNFTVTAWADATQIHIAHNAGSSQTIKYYAEYQPWSP